MRPTYAVVALLVLTVTGAAHAAPSHGKLYDKKVDIAAAKILWGNQTRPTKPRDTLAIDPPFQRFGSEETRVEVLEFFAYNAHRTRSGPRKRWGKRADDVMERWRDSLPERVTVIRVPFAWQKLPNEPGYSRVRRGHLRSILTAQVLGIEDRVHQRMAKALDDDTRAFSNQASARAHFEALGVSAERFSKAWDSPEARRRSRLAAALRDTLFETSIRHGGTRDRLTPPIFIINGEHMVATFNTRNAEKSFQVANHLIAEALKPDPERSDEDLRWRALYEEVRRATPSHIDWGNEIAPAPGQVIAIDPPLKTDDPDRVEIEWFFTYINRGHDARRTTGWLTGEVEWLMFQWWERLPRPIRGFIRPKLTPVAGIPGHDNALREHERVHQELAFGWGYGDTFNLSQLIHNAIREQFAYYAPALIFDGKKAIRKFMTKHRIPKGNYRKVAASGRPAKRADAANTRLSILTKRAGPVALTAPRDPIILVNGRYLIQGTTAGGFSKAVKILNHLVRSEIARIEG